MLCGACLCVLSYCLHFCFHVLRDEEFLNVLDKVLRASRAPNTVTRYSRSFELWKSWCIQHNCSPLPACADDIARYFVELHIDNAPFSRIEGIFYSIKWFHDCKSNCVNPCDQKFLHLLLEGLRRLSAKPVV